MVFSYGSGQQWIDDNEKCRQIAGNFDCYADAAVRVLSVLAASDIVLAFSEKVDWESDIDSVRKLWA